MYIYFYSLVLQQHQGIIKTDIFGSSTPIGYGGNLALPYSPNNCDMHCDLQYFRGARCPPYTARRVVGASCRSPVRGIRSLGFRLFK